MPLRDNDVTRKAIAEARVEMIERGAGHEVVVSSAKGPVRASRSAGARRSGSACAAPGAADLDLRAGSADLEAVGPLGAVDVKTASGDVLLEDVATLEVDDGQRRRARSGRRAGAEPSHRLRRRDGAPQRRAAVRQPRLGRSLRRRGRCGAVGDDGLGRRARPRCGRWRDADPGGLGRRSPRDQAGRAPLHRCAAR